MNRRVMTKGLFFTALSLLLAFVISAVPGKVMAGNLTVYAGATFFDNPELDSVVLVEFPFTLNRHEFEFFRDSVTGIYSARIFAQVTVYGVDGLPVDSATTYFAAAVADAKEAAEEGIKLFNNLGLLLRPGVYSGRLAVVDVVSKAEGEFFYDKIVVEPPRKDRLTIGGKCLAYHIAYVGDSARAASIRTVKNGFNVLCNPLGIFGVKDTAVYFYAELYNLDYSPDNPSDFRLAYAVLDDSGEVFRDLGYRIKQKPGSTVVITESFDIAWWPVGNYRLNVVATDLLSQQSDSQQVAFRIFSPDELPSQELPAQVWDPADTLSPEVRERLVFYLLDPVEKRMFNSLSEEGRANYLDQYWQQHDSNPDTELNEDRLEALKRYEFCNKYFSTDGEKNNGWSTDRGRIYMIYGPWEEKDDIQTPVVGNPFIIWYYHSIREGAVFVFEDKRNIGDYQLVHSNVEGETYNSEWKTRLDEELYKID